jgi:hypothetical protein
VRDVALGGLQLTREDPQKRALTDTVRADQTRVATGSHPKGHPVEEHFSSRVGVGEVRDGDVAHEATVRVGRRAGG